MDDAKDLIDDLAHTGFTRRIRNAAQQFVDLEQLGFTALDETVQHRGIGFHGLHQRGKLLAGSLTLIRQAVLECNALRNVLHGDQQIMHAVFTHDPVERHRQKTPFDLAHCIRHQQFNGRKRIDALHEAVLDVRREQQLHVFASIVVVFRIEHRDQGVEEIVTGLDVAPEQAPGRR